MGKYPNRQYSLLKMNNAPDGPWAVKIFKFLFIFSSGFKENEISSKLAETQCGSNEEAREKSFEKLDSRVLTKWVFTSRNRESWSGWIEFELVNMNLNTTIPQIIFSILLYESSVWKHLDGYEEKCSNSKKYRYPSNCLLTSICLLFSICASAFAERPFPLFEKISSHVILPS